MGVCDKYGLNWCMEAGSLLGTVRHKGFIPWDDDIDVAMPRPDYDKLLTVLPRELPPHLVMQTSANSPMRSQFMRIRDSRTTGIDPYWANKHYLMNMGIFVDVTPLDARPSQMSEQRKLMRIAAFFTRLNNWHYDQEVHYKRIKRIISLPFYCLLGDRRLFDLREYFLRRLDWNAHEYCAYSLMRFGFSNRWSRKTCWYQEYEDAPFEYLTVKIPKRYDEVLTQCYGDWRTPLNCGGDHGEIILDADRCYKDVLKERFGYTEKELARIR